nr:hypothetical protein [Tanacetum cinerariifolium]
MGRDTVQLETTVSTISQEYLLEFTSEYGISEALHPELPRPEDRIVDFPEGKPLLLGRREGVPNCRGLVHKCPKIWDAGRECIFLRGRKNTRHTPYPHPETTRGATFHSGIKPQILPGGRANRVIEVEDPAAATDSSGVPFTIERSPLDFANEAGPEDQETVAPEVSLPEDVPTTRGVPEAGPAERVAATDPPAVKECRKRGHDGADANAPPKVLRRDHADPRPTGSTRRGKSFASIELGTGSTRPTLVPQSAPADVSDQDPLSSKGAAAAGDPKSKNTSFASMVGSPESIYRPEWGIPNGSTLDTPEACQDLVDHIAPPGGNGVATAPENREALLEAEADMKKVAKDKSAKLSQELEDMRALFSDLQVSNERLSQQVSTLQGQRCTEMDARLDALSIDFDEELYPHMLTAIAGRRSMIGRGLRLAVMKCDKSIKLRQAFADVMSAGIAKGMSEGLKHGWVRELRPSSSQLTIPVYPEVRDPIDPWACKEEMLLADAIAANVSHAEKKKKYRVVGRTHGVGFTHHAWSDGVPVSVPTVVPQGLAILLADAAT